jgi:hypothetical protein
MEQPRNDDWILDMLKALADESRLALLRYLNEKEYSVNELAEKLSLSDPTISHHLARLREARLVTLRMAGNQRFYRTNASGLARFKALAMEIEKLPPEPIQAEEDNTWIAALGWSAEDAQILRGHTAGKKLTRLPTGPKKTAVILRWLATLFEPNRLYSEPEVNAVIKTAYADDYVSLRRDLVDFGYLRRERGGGKYWLTPADQEEVKP